MKRDTARAGNPGKRYRLYGVTMESDFLFANPLPRVSLTPDLSFSCSSTAPRRADWTKPPVYASINRTGNGEIGASIHVMDDCHVVHFAGTVDFYLYPDRIIAHLLDPAYCYLVEILLLGEIFSLWLELKGVRMIHASAAVVDDSAIAFLSTNQGGKSSLAAAFMQQGYPLLTDDIVPVEERNDRFLARPGYHAMRLWPDQATYFHGIYEDLEIVHPEFSKRRIIIGHDNFGTFCSEEKPLKVIYVPQRLGSDDSITIEPVPNKNAFFELIQNSFTAGIVEALGFQSQRMNFFARMVMQVPMRRLTYPEGFHHLSHVVDTVLEDSESL